MQNGGKSTVEIKNVQKQSLTRQLRIQREFSKGNGLKPELIINKGAKLSAPLRNAGFDIKTYQNVAVPSDVTKSTPSSAEMKTKVVYSTNGLL